jgi:hypothetical protein
VLDINNKLLYGDQNQNPYTADTDSYIYIPIDTSNASGINISFFAQCDTEYDTNNRKDYMQLFVSLDGDNFDIVDSRDEYMLDDDSNE